MQTINKLKKYILGFIGFSLLWSGLILLFNFTIDPTHFFRKNPRIGLNPNERYMVAGFIKNFIYDQVIVGTSRTQNISINRLKKTLHANPIRLSISGSPIDIQLKVLESVFKQKKANSVIWELIPHNLKDSKDPDPTFPEGLYTDLWSDILIYLFQFNTTFWSLLQLKNIFIHKNHNDLETYGSWYEQNKSLFGREKFLKTIDFNALKRSSDDLNFETEAIKYFDEKVKKIIVDHPEIKFIIYIGPFSIFHVLTTNYSYLKVRRHIMDVLTELSNVEFYDFESHEKIVCNLDAYKDTTHYSQDVDNYIIDCFSTGDNRVYKNTINHYQEKYKNLQNKTIAEILRK